MSAAMQSEQRFGYLAKAKIALAEKDLVSFLTNIGAAEHIHQNEPEALLSALMTMIEGLYEFNRYKEAADVVERALTVTKESGQKHTLLQQKGILLGKLGKLDEAIDTFAELLEGGLSPIWGYNHLAWTYLYKYRLDPAKQEYLHKALNFCQQAVKLFSPADPPELLKSVLVNLGNVYWHLEEYHDALQVFQDARVYAEKDPKILNNIAATYVQLRILEEAERYLDEAEQLAEATHNHFEAAQANLIHARIHEWLLKDYMGAKEHFLIAFDKFNLVNATLEACKCFDNIMRLGELLQHESMAILSQRFQGPMIHQFGQEETLQLERRSIP